MTTHEQDRTDLVDIGRGLREVMDGMSGTQDPAARRALLERADRLIKAKGEIVNVTPAPRRRIRW